jgi:hypothetical protein
VPDPTAAPSPSAGSPTEAPSAPPTDAPSDPIAGAAQLVVASPEDGVLAENEPVAIQGTSDAGSVLVRALWIGPPGGGASRETPAPPAVEPRTVRVRGGTFSDDLLLPTGRWTLTIETAAADGVSPSSATRTVDVKHSGVFVAVEARQPAWIRVWVDGELVEEGHVFRRGEDASYTGRRSVVVSSGNAGGTWVTLNGAGYGSLGEQGAVATWSFEKGKAPRAL